MGQVTTLQEQMQQMALGHMEPSERWVRVKLGDTTIADSKKPTLLIQFGRDVMPTYFFAQDELTEHILSDPIERDGKRWWTIRADGQEVSNGAWSYVEPAEHLADLQDKVTFIWHNEMLCWYEEAEQVFVHARDPHKRVDVMKSSRRVQVKYNGKTIADTHSPYMLYETWLPTRYYIPQADVNMEYLTETAHVTACPYKGTAQYWTLQVGDESLKNGVWRYPEPIIENPKIKGLLCFYNEFVDIYLDGVLQERPQTPFS